MLKDHLVPLHIPSPSGSRKIVFPFAHLLNVKFPIALKTAEVKGKRPKYDKERGHYSA